MADTFEQWSAWGAWQVHSVKRGVSTTYRSGRVLWLRSTDPQAPSKVLRREQRFKTEATPRAGEPGGIPSKPKPETPVKAEPTPEVLPPTPETEKAVSEAVVKELEGTYVDIKYRTPKGEVKTVTTKRLSQVAIPGEVMAVGISSPYKTVRYDPFYDVSKQVLKRTPLDFVREIVTWKTIEPTLTPEMKYILGHQAAVGVEPGMRQRYEKLYEESIVTGDIAPLQEFWKSGFKRMYSEEQLIYAKTFQGYEPPKPKPIKKVSLKHRQKLGAYIFMPFGERFQYTMASLTETRFKPGTLEPVKGATLLESLGMVKIREQSEQIFGRLEKSGDWLGIYSRVIQSPVVLPSVVYGAGAGMGALKATTWGAKGVQIGLFEKTIGAAPAWTYKYTFDITRAGIIEKAVGGYFGYEAIKGGVEAAEAGKLSEYLSGIAITMPFIILPYKYGYRAGMGFVQRRAAMAKVTDPLARVQQQALYDSMRITRKLGEPQYDVKPYDITRVKKVGPYEAKQLTTYIESLRAKYIHRATIGGSTAMEIQTIPSTFRAGGYPKRLFDIVTRRQQLAFKTGLQKGIAVKPLKTGGVPGDIDILLRGLLAKEKSVTVSMLKRLDIHVHKSRIGEYYGFGEITYPSTKGLIIDPFLKGKPLKVKLLSIKEQFMRTSISVLPSEQPITGYRAFKDIPTWYDVGELLTFQKGGTKLRIAMEKFLYPEKYPTPKITLSERFIKYIGGAVEPQYIETISGYIEPVYPEYIYPKAYVPYALAAGGYRIAPYTTPYKTPKIEIDYAKAYPKKEIDYYIGKKPSIPKAAAYPTDPYRKKPTVTDKIIPDYPLSYLAPSDYVPPYVPPDYPPSYLAPPDYVPPDYPSYLPPYIPSEYPPYISPPYKPPSYPPPYPPTKRPLKKQTIKKRELPIVDLGQGYAPFVKDRVYVKGKKVYSERYIRMGKTPLSERDANRLGGFLTDESVARTFKVKPVGGIPQPLDMNIPYWSMLSNKFYKKDKRMIEKTTYAIDSKGELEGITAKGLLARMERKSKKLVKQKISYKPKISKVSRRLKEPSNIYDDIMSDMNEAFEKMNRNMMKGGI